MDARFPAARRRGRTLPATLIFLVALAVTACAGPAATPVPTVAPTAAPTATPAATPTASPVAAFPITLTDDEGTQVELKAEPQKIVSLTPAATETLFELGLGDRIVGKVEDFTV